MHSILLWVLYGGVSVVAAILLWLYRRGDLLFDDWR